MKPKANYKCMDTRMLIGLAMFQIEDQPVVIFTIVYYNMDNEKIENFNV
jgi:hypothetical protein